MPVFIVNFKAPALLEKLVDTEGMKIPVVHWSHHEVYTDNESEKDARHWAESYLRRYTLYRPGEYHHAMLVSVIPAPESKPVLPRHPGRHTSPHV
jgi:hypothetical protein